MFRGEIIVIEGCDAAGKKTQSKRLARVLEESGPVQVMSFPRYDGPFGDILLRCLRKDSVMYRKSDQEDSSDQRQGKKYIYSKEDDLVALRGLFALDQYEAAADIRALQEAGITLILDRYWPSNVCYGVEDGFDEEILKNISSSLPPASIYFFIDVDVEEATKRRPIARDRYESDKEKQSRIRDRYLEMWIKNRRNTITYTVDSPEDSLFYTLPLWIIIDGHQELEKITEQMLSWVKLLRLKPVRKDCPIVERYLSELGPSVAENLRNQIEEKVKRKR